MLAIQKEHFEWFVEQTVDNISNKKIILQKDSTIHDLNNVVHEQQIQIGSYRRDSTKYIEQISTLNFKADKLQKAYKTQDTALTQIRKKKGILEVAVIGLVIILTLSLVHPL